MPVPAAQRATNSLQQLQLPDAWQAEALSLLRSGHDVVVQAPTGAGKTFIFELLVARGLRGRAVFTVPTRALANDKRLEWRRRGWPVGIQTGDLSEDLEAPVVVATLETQRGTALRGDGPDLLVIDEYQMLADPVRGPNYELVLALTPPTTRLLLLSGTVANPDAVVAWLARLGRPARLVAHPDRPVPLEEVFLESLPRPAPPRVTGFWPRLVARALVNGLGPVLLFAPRRRAAEQMARALAGLPLGDPLTLSPEQESLAGPLLTRLLRQRIGVHHSGLDYAQRAALVEPLAKAGQLRAVVATTGLAAGINFSMRSVVVTEAEYVADNATRLLEPDALLQMFGRAGRRGLDDRGYVLALPDRPRLADGRPRHLRRPARLDWPSLLSVLAAAADADAPSPVPPAATATADVPFAAARRLLDRLFTDQPPTLGCERSLAAGPGLCGLWSDAERSRLARSLPELMQVPEGHWEPAPAPVQLPAAVCLTPRPRSGGWQPALADPQLARTLGVPVPAPGEAPVAPAGHPVRLPATPTAPSARLFGRAVVVAARRADGLWRLAPALRRALAARLPDPRALAPLTPPAPDTSALRASLPRLAPLWTHGAVLHGWREDERELAALLDPSPLPLLAYRDASGRGLVDPPLRRETPESCRRCPHFHACLSWEPAGGGPAFAWRRLGLVEPDGRPTRRGRIASLFHHGEGLAVAAALEDPSYPADDLARDLANLRAGFRFGHLTGRTDRLALACRRAYGDANHEGYLEHGLPAGYGDGAAEVVLERLRHPGRALRRADDTLHPGDIERAFLEWRSLLRHVDRLPGLAWDRWSDLQQAVRTLLPSLGLSASPTDLPPLTAAQLRPAPALWRL